MKRSTLNRKRTILSSKNGGNVARDPKGDGCGCGCGCGCGRAGSEVSPAELPESGSLWPAWQDSTHSSREQEESGLGWWQLQTWPNGVIRGPPDHVVIHMDHRPQEESRAFSSILIFQVKKTRDILKSSYWWLSNYKLGFLASASPRYYKNIHNQFSLSLSLAIFPSFFCFEVHHFFWKFLPGLSSLLSSRSHKSFATFPLLSFVAPHWTIWNSSFIYMII